MNNIQNILFGKHTDEYFAHIIHQLQDSHFLTEQFVHAYFNNNFNKNDFHDYNLFNESNFNKNIKPYLNDNFFNQLEILNANNAFVQNKNSRNNKKMTGGAGADIEEEPPLFFTFCTSFLFVAIAFLRLFADPNAGIICGPGDNAVNCTQALISIDPWGLMEPGDTFDTLTNLVTNGNGEINWAATGWMMMGD